MDYPRVLIISLGRVNASDNTANGLFLRNIFASPWPRDKLAQIYIAGDNGDEGFFGQYYKFGSHDRRLSSIFDKLKKSGIKEASASLKNDNTHSVPNVKKKKLKGYAIRMLKDTGVYELIFRPRISAEMERWVKEFEPDIVFAQGHNLTFAWLPVLIKKATGAKLAILVTDDWPTFLYSGLYGEPIWFRWLVRRAVKAAEIQLFNEVDVPFAICQPMADEYELRYGKKFHTLNHADDPARFVNAEAKRVHPDDIISIVMIGSYNRCRWPLLIDADEACKLLNDQGIKTRVAVLSSAIDPDGIKTLSKAEYVDLMPDPGHNMLPSYLKGADILLLAEGFDKDFVSVIKLAISSKAHLFMFSHRPIIVYAHPDTGTGNYAREYGWGRVVNSCSSKELMVAIREIIEHQNKTAQMVSEADKVAKKFHTHFVNRDALLQGLASITSEE